MVKINCLKNIKVVALIIIMIAFSSGCSLSNNNENDRIELQVNKNDEVDNTEIDEQNTIGESEGTPYTEKDYQILKKYETDSSESLIQDLHIKNFERAVSDGLVEIGVDDLVDNIVYIENHLSDYTDAQERSKLKTLYKNYLMLYLLGTDNNLIYNFQDKKLTNQMRDSFGKTISEYPQTKTAQIVKEYLLILEKNDFVINVEDHWKPDNYKLPTLDEFIN